MKVKILQQDLITPLQAVSRSVGVRSTLPVLANILIQAGSGKLKLSATNLEIGVIKSISASIQEEGDITVPAKTFLEIVQSLEGLELQLEATGEQLKISAPNFNGTLNGISSQEFPAIPLSSEKAILISAKVLAKSIPEISFAAAVDEGRPVLTGILTEIKKNKLELIATDGFRLAHKSAEIDSPQANFRSLIPRRTFEEVVRLITEDLAEEDEAIEISTSENQNQMIFKIGHTQASSRLIEGNFPSWEKIIPQSFQNRTIIDRETLLKGIKLASVFARGEANIIKLETQEKTVKISSEAKELGSQETSLEASSEGEGIAIAFNSKFLLDALSATSSSQVSIEFSGNLSPALIKPIGEEGLEYVIMPIKTS